jgi:hypothetical protein
MVTEKIPAGEMPPNYSDWLRSLAPGEAFRTPCIWEHAGGGCPGGKNIHSAARRVGIQVRTTCKLVDVEGVQNQILYCERI